MNTKRNGVKKETEAGFQGAVVRMARALSWATYHTRFSWGSDRGFPDLILVKAGQPVIYAELKSDTGKVTIEQAAWLATLEGATGTEVYCWRPKDWDAITERLKR